MNRSEGQWTQPELSVPAHRGLAGTLDTSRGLGQHWSEEKGIAHNLAGLGRTAEEMYYKPRTTTVIHADIPFGSVETDTPTLRKLDVLNIDGNKDYTEKEVTARKGATVKVKGITKTLQSPKLDKKTGNEIPETRRSRTRTYNPPREMRA